MIAQLRIKSTFRLFLFLLAADAVQCCSVNDKANLHGIWALKCDCLPYEQDIRSKLLGLVANKNEVTVDGILIKINPDGTFKQCNEEYKEGRWISGKWEVGKNSVFLAFRRQYYGPPVDVLLRVNKLQTWEQRLQMSGVIQTGKFALPQNHPDFFQHLIPSGEVLGPFTMNQILSTKSLSRNDDVDDLELHF